MTGAPQPDAADIEKRLHGDLPIMDAASAAARIDDDATILTSGFGSVGYPKLIPIALAASDRNLSLTVVSSGNVGEEIDVTLVDSGAIARRFSYQSSAVARNVTNRREIARSTETPLATGENRFRVHEFKDLLYDFGVDIVTPDPTTCGGLAESKAIANRAEENYIVFSPHNVCSPIGTMGCVHLGACVPNFGVLEYHSLEVDWWNDMLTRDESLIQDGYIQVPEEPGLGIELNEDVVEDHLAEGEEGFR